MFVTHFFLSGQKRWFALKDGTLLWFKEAQTSASTVTKENCAGSLLLRDGCQVRRVQDKSSLVVVTPTGKPYELVAYDNPTRDVWLTYLTEACGGVRARAPTIKTTPQKLKGWLKRKGGPGKLKPWKKVFAAQQDSELNFFDSDDVSKPAIASVNLFDISSVDVTYDDGISPTFEVRTTQGGIQYLCALSEEDLEFWTAGLAQFWEQKKARGASKGKASGPAAFVPAKVSQEVRMSDTLIVKAPLSDAAEVEKRNQVLDALENSSDEDVVTKTHGSTGGGSGHGVGGTGGGGGGGGGEPDEDFDSLMDALGSEKHKLSQRASALSSSASTMGGVSHAGASVVSDEELKEMESASKERMQSARKPTVIKTDTALSEFSASGKLTRKEAGSPKPEDPQRSRSKTEIQRRLAEKEKELNNAKPKADEEDLDRLSAILAEESDDPFVDSKPKPVPPAVSAKPKGPLAALATAATAPRSSGWSDDDEVTAKPAVPSKKSGAWSDDGEKQLTQSSEKPKASWSDEDDEVVAPQLKTALSKASTKSVAAATPAKPSIPMVDKDDDDVFGDAKEPIRAPKKNSVDDDFDGLNAIPSFGFSDDEDFGTTAATTKQPAKAAAVATVALKKSSSAVASVVPAKKSVSSEPAPSSSSSSSSASSKVVPKKNVVRKRVRKAKQSGPWVVGDRVMAQFEEDELWYKSKVVKVTGGRCTVEFLGYGNTQLCTEDQMLPIPDDELSEGDEIEELVEEEDEQSKKANMDADALFNQELDSMLSLPPKVRTKRKRGGKKTKFSCFNFFFFQPADDYSSEEFEQIKKPAPNDSDEDDLPVPPPPPDDSDEDEDVEVAAPAPVLKKAQSSEGSSSVNDRKAAVAKSQSGPDCDKIGLFEAASRGDLKTVTALVTEGKVYVDYQKRKQPVGWSALHFAVQSGQEAIVAFLLKQGADPNLRDGRERPPLHKAVASEEAKPGVVKKLLEAKADVFAVNDCGDNVLHEARSPECVEVVFKSLSVGQRKQLLSAHGQDGATPLHRAVGRGREISEMFVDTYPESVEEQDALGETPLFAAVKKKGKKKDWKMFVKKKKLGERTET